MIRSEIRTAVVAAVGAALMSAVVACAPGASTADRAAAQCMTENGVPAPPDGHSTRRCNSASLAGSASRLCDMVRRIIADLSVVRQRSHDALADFLELVAAVLARRLGRASAGSSCG